jgi:hypothetical protein
MRPFEAFAERSVGYMNSGVDGIGNELPQRF